MANVKIGDKLATYNWAWGVEYGALEGIGKKSISL